MRLLSSTLSSAAFARVLPILRRHAGIHERQLDVVQGGCARQQIERLKDEPDLLVPDARQLVVVHARHFLAVQEVAALARRVEAPDQIHQRRLARTRRPHDGDVFAALDRMDTPRSAWISSSPIRYVFHRSWVSISAMGMDTTAVIRRFQYYISRCPHSDSRPHRRYTQPRLLVVGLQLGHHAGIGERRRIAERLAFGDVLAAAAA